MAFNDVDFYELQVDQEIVIAATIGDLPDALLSLDQYGEVLRGFDPATGLVEDEPRAGIETVLTVRLTVGNDLEPRWLLYSERAEQQGLERGLPWKDRVAIGAVRIGSYANTNLSWNRNSVLNRLTDDRADLGTELARAGREARASFGEQAAPQLAQTLTVVNDTAASLGVDVGRGVRPLLDSHAVSIGDGAIALHDETGVPLRSLGTGSARLLIAGLQRRAAESASVALLDEVEYGLEPHRIALLLEELGAKDERVPLQVFMTSHSPVALRELRGSQVFVVRHRGAAAHQVLLAGEDDDTQSTLRSDPEAFLAKSVIVCEGASEVGLARGLDQFWKGEGGPSFFASGGGYVNVGGSSPDRCYTRARALMRLGYRVIVFLDADKPATPAIEEEFIGAGGERVTWRAGLTLEDELFRSLADREVDALLDMAITINGRKTVEEHIQTKSNGTARLVDIEAELVDRIPVALRELLGIASRVRNAGWFKCLTTYQTIGKTVVGPGLGRAEPGFQAVIEQLRAWMHAS